MTRWGVVMPTSSPRMTRMPNETPPDQARGRIAQMLEANASELKKRSNRLKVVWVVLVLAALFVWALRV